MQVVLPIYVSRMTHVVAKYVGNCMNINYITLHTYIVQSHWKSPPFSQSYVPMYVCVYTKAINELYPVNVAMIKTTGPLILYMCNPCIKMPHSTAHKNVIDIESSCSSEEQKTFWPQRPSLVTEQSVTDEDVRTYVPSGQTSYTLLFTAGMWKLNADQVLLYTIAWASTTSQLKWLWEIPVHTCIRMSESGYTYDSNTILIYTGFSYGFCGSRECMKKGIWQG